jgi:Carboxypeptidase regulatory-like domain
MRRLRTLGPLSLTFLLTTTLSLQAHAQSPDALATPASSPTPATEPTNIAAGKLPDSPGSHTTQQSIGYISGTVLDANGAQVPGAIVALDNTDSKVERTLTTDNSGSFKFDAIEPGRFDLTVTSPGFATWVSTGLPLSPGQNFELPPVSLEIASAMTNVEVTVTRHEIAEDQIHFEENQRVFGVIPNFYVSYIPNAAPLSSGQKFRLALRTSTDPVSIAIPGLIAGIEQSQNAFSGYGQGAQGYAKRFGASSADSFIGIMFTNAILPSVLHQDPRYFYRGVGSIRSRAMYAISTVFICKGDNGRWQPNYSNVLGNLASAGISNAYYPSNQSGARLTIDNWLIGTASGAIGTLFQEFLVKRLSHGIQPQPGQ